MGNLRFRLINLPQVHAICKRESQDLDQSLTVAWGQALCHHTHQPPGSGFKSATAFSCSIAKVSITNIIITECKTLFPIRKATFFTSARDGRILFPGTVEKCSTTPQPGCCKRMKQGYVHHGPKQVRWVPHVILWVCRKKILELLLVFTFLAIKVRNWSYM